MIDDEDYWLANEALSAHEWRGVQALAYGAPTEFEVIANLKVGQSIVDRLVSMGLAESGEPAFPYRTRGYTVGYQLTRLGWKVRERGRYPKR